MNRGLNLAKVHLKYTSAYLTCTDVKKGPDGLVSEITCTLNETAPENREPAQPKVERGLTPELHA